MARLQQCSRQREVCPTALRCAVGPVGCSLRPRIRQYRETPPQCAAERHHRSVRPQLDTPPPDAPRARPAPTPRSSGPPRPPRPPPPLRPPCGPSTRGSDSPRLPAPTVVVRTPSQWRRSHLHGFLREPPRKSERASMPRSGIARAGRRHSTKADSQSSDLGEPGYRNGGGVLPYPKRAGRPSTQASPARRSSPSLRHPPWCDLLPSPESAEHILSSPPRFRSSSVSHRPQLSVLPALLSTARLH